MEINQSQYTLDDYFPVIDLEGKVAVLQDYALVQLKKALVENRIGSLLVGDVTAGDQASNEEFHETIGKVVAVGPVFYKDPKTLDPWPEGERVKVGDFVRIPEFQAGRFRIKDRTGYEVAFIHARGGNILNKIEDPLWAIQNIRTFSKIGGR